MKFILIDIFVVLMVGSGAAVVVGTIRQRRKQSLKGRMREARRLGTLNLDKAFLAREHTCFSCGKSVDPKRDLWGPTQGWFHSACMDELEKEI